MGKASRDKHSRKSPPSIRVGAGVAPVFCLSRSILLIGAFSLLVPVVVNDDFYYPFIFLKSILFRGAVQLMVVLYVLLASISPSHRPRLNRIIWAVLAYFGVMFISSLPGISVDAWSSWWGDFARMGGMFTQLHLLAYFFVLVQTLKEESDWVILFASSLFSGILIGFSGLIQRLNLDFIYRYAPSPDKRISGATGNANWIASHMVLNFFIVFWFLSRREKRSVLPLVAKTWFFLLLGLDFFLIAWEAVGSGSGILSRGFDFLPVGLFALLLHLVGLVWFFLRRSVPAGSLVLGLSGCYYLFWIYQSQTRSAVAGLVGSLGLVALFSLSAGIRKRTKWMVAGLLVIACILVSVLWLNRHSPWVRDNLVMARYTSLSLAENQNRLLAWKAGCRAILDHPLFGWGLENYKSAFDKHFPPKLSTGIGEEVWYDRAHNLIVDLGTTAGIFGLLAYSVLYGMMILFLLRSWFRTRDITDSLLIAALLLAYLFQSLFTFDTVNTDGIVFLLLAYVAYLCGLEASPPEAPPARPVSISYDWRTWLAPCLAVILMGAAFLFTVKMPYESNLLLNRALASETVRDQKSGSRRYVFREETLDLFQAANDYQTTGRHMVREEFANYAVKLSASSEVPLEERVRVVKRAIAFLEESIRQEPSNARHYAYRASVVNRTIDLLMKSDPATAKAILERTVALLQTAESLCSTRPRMYLEKAQALEMLGRKDESITALKRAVDLNPAVKEPHVDLIAVCISAGRPDDAAYEYQKLKGLSFALTAEEYDRLIRLYNEKKQLAPMASLYREQLEKTPNDPKLLAHLATTYREMGELDRARETALKAAALSPELAASLQEFLDSLAQARRR